MQRIEAERKMQELLNTLCRYLICNPAGKCFHLQVLSFKFFFHLQGCDPFNQNSDRSDREKRKNGGPVFSKLFRLDRTDPLSFGPKCPGILGGMDHAPSFLILIEFFKENLVIV